MARKNERADPEVEAIAKRLAPYFEEHGAAAALARDMQVHPSQVSRFLGGKRGLDAVEFVRLMTALAKRNINLNEIFGGARAEQDLAQTTATATAEALVNELEKRGLFQHAQLRARQRGLGVEKPAKKKRKSG